MNFKLEFSYYETLQSVLLTHITVALELANNEQNYIFKLFSAIISSRFSLSITPKHLSIQLRSYNIICSGSSSIIELYTPLLS